jgi:hypothetical protein
MTHPVKRHGYSGHFTGQNGNPFDRQRLVFMCFLCSADLTFRVNPDQTTRQAQQLHHLTHGHELRTAVAALVQDMQRVSR